MLNPRVAAAAMGIELVAFYGFQFRRSPFWIVVAGVIAANVISTLAGFLVLGLLSSLVLGVLPSLEHGPHWLVYPVFFLAWASVLASNTGCIARSRSGVGFPIS
jgi:uncharacterized membrane protein YhaH (DUF805 family)